MFKTDQFTTDLFETANVHKRTRSFQITFRKDHVLNSRRL